jgi:hypothetical protein
MRQLLPTSNLKSKDTIRGKDEQPRLFSPCARVISGPRHRLGIFGWETSWCTGRQGRGLQKEEHLGPDALCIIITGRHGRGLQKEEHLGPDALCIRTKKGFNCITSPSREAGRLEYRIGSLPQVLFERIHPVFLLSRAFNTWVYSN